MYIFGGSTPDDLLNDMWAFDLTNNTWNKIEISNDI